MKTGLESQNMTVRGFNGIFTGAVHAGFLITDGKSPGF
ncbi:MAG: hypothetical protein CM15mP58_22050 [Burkholderiaceae bacterium]|nr:MAG: hypothetical protein CM15mP58_22050 [Burkholderiaceae bacterium]